MPVQDGTSRLAPQFKVWVNGSELPAQAASDLIGVEVHEDVDAAGMFCLRMINWDMTQRKVTWSDDPLFSEGNELKVQMGYLNQLKTLIVAEITGLEPEFSAQEIPLLNVRGYDRRHRLLRGRKTRSFTQVKDSDIASQIANEGGLTPQADDTGEILPYVLQHNQSDMEFLEERAQRYQYEVVVQDKILYFQRRKNTGSAALTLALGDDLIEFFPRLSTMGQVAEFSVRAWSPKDKQAIEAKSDASDLSTQMGGSTSGPAVSQKAFGQTQSSRVDYPVFTQAEADKIAKSRLNESALAYITSEGTCMGRTDLRAGLVVKVEGLGNRFSGLYYVIATRHVFSPDQGYRTNFIARRTAA